MNFGDMHVKEEDRRQGPCAGFTLEEEPRVKVKSGSMTAKLSLCAVVLAAALVVELTGAVQKKEQVQPAGAQEEESGTDDALGALHYVEAPGQESGVLLPGYTKWSPPVSASEITLLQEETLVGFSALSSTVKCCCAGEVYDIGEDETFGKYVRLQHAGDVFTVTYGFEEVGVKVGQSVTAGETLGTVYVGKTVYFAVTSAGVPQDPRDYVELGIQKEA